MKRRKHKRKIVSRTHKLLILNIVLVCFFMLGIGYSLLGTEMDLFGDIFILRILEPYNVGMVEFSEPIADGGYELNEPIDLRFTIRNNRSGSITNAVLTSDMTGDEWTAEEILGWETKTYEGSYTVTEDNIIDGFVNIDLIFTGTNSKGNPIREEKHLIIDTIADPIENCLQLVIEETSTPSNGEYYQENETIYATFTATNIGNVTIDNAYIGSELTGDIWDAGDIEPGQSSYPYVGQYTITPYDAVAGYVILDGYAYGTTIPYGLIRVNETLEFGDVPNFQDSFQVEINETSTPPNGSNYENKDDITFHIKVTNIGSHSIDDVVVNILNGESTYTLPAISAGQFFETDLEYRVSIWDLRTGSAVITVNATGIDAIGRPVQSEETITINNLVSINPNGLRLEIVELSMAPNEIAYDIGENIYFTIYGINDKNSEPISFRIKEVTSGDDWHMSVGSGDRYSNATMSYQVTEADILNGGVSNYAYAYDTSGHIITSTTYIHNTMPPNPNYSINIQVRDEQPTYQVGDTIVFDLTLYNNGNITINNATASTTVNNDTWTLYYPSPRFHSETKTSSFTISQDMVSNGQVCIGVDVTGTTNETGNPTRTFTNTHCVNVS